MEPIRTALAVLFLAATLTHAEPLSNEDLLALRSAERIAELNADAPSNSPRSQSRFEEAWDLMTPVLERPLPAGRQVWISLGRWAAAANDPTAGAVVLAGLRREVPDFMSDETLADIAARLNANTKARGMAEEAAARLDAGDSPADAVLYLNDVLGWRTLLDSLDRTTFKYPVAPAALFDGLAAAMDRADLPDLAEQARVLAKQHFSRITDPADQARALVYGAEGRILFSDRAGAITRIDRAKELAEAQPDGPETDRLWADIARLRARTGDIERAVAIAAVLDREHASRVHYEIVRTRLADGDLDSAEMASRAITEPLYRGLATVAMVETLASQGRIGEAEAMVVTMRDPVLQAEAFAMVSLYDPRQHANVNRWRNQLTAAESSAHRTAATARIVAAYPQGHPDTRVIERFMHEELYRLREKDGHPLLVLETARTAAQRGSRELSRTIIQLSYGREGGEIVYMYGVFAQAADWLKPKRPDQR